MHIYLDTANIEEIRKANDIIPLDGVTTNPTLIAKEGRDYNAALKEIAGVVNGPVSAETVALDAAGMLKEGRAFSKLHKNIIIKVPMTEQGMKACRLLTKEGMRVNVTLCFSANQALMAAKAGAFIISPFIGRLDDIGQTGMELIGEIRQVYDNYAFPTKILAASVRHPIHVKEAALAGADIATLPYKVWQQLFNHSLTDSGIKTFLDDWAKLQQSKTK
jgi:transaldolase